MPFWILHEAPNGEDGPAIEITLDKCFVWDEWIIQVLCNFTKPNVDFFMLHFTTWGTFVWTLCFGGVSRHKFFFILLHLFGLETIFGYDSSSHYTWNSPLKSRTLQVRCRQLSTHHVWEFGEQTGSEKNILLKQFPTPDMSCSAERKACQVSKSNRASKNPTWNVEAVYNNLLDLSSFPLKSIHQPSICNTFHQ